MIIGFYGAKQSGKNYCANRLEDILAEHVITCAQFAFAQSLKTYVSMLVSEDYYTLMSLLEDDFACVGVSRNKLPTTVTALARLRRDPRALTVEDGKHRWLLQQVGTEVFRDTVDTEYWVKLCNERMGRSKARIKVITDVRFSNEAKLCDKVIYVIGGTKGDSHASENQEIEAHFVIDNHLKVKAIVVDAINDALHQFGILDKRG